VACSSVLLIVCRWISYECKLRKLGDSTLRSSRRYYAFKLVFLIASIDPFLDHDGVLVIGYCEFCDYGREAAFSRHDVRVKRHGRSILTGHSRQHGLWIIKLPTPQPSTVPSTNALHLLDSKSIAVHLGCRRVASFALVISI
jgi:hypothetical protein